MPYLLNLAYILLLLILSPWLVYKALTTGKIRRGLWAKLTGSIPPGLDQPAPVWFHGVSVGEIHLLRTLVARFRARHPDIPCVISTTTDTGMAEAKKWFPDLPAFFWPLDFTWAVKHALRTVSPRLVVLAECELWPNFLEAARQRGVPVAVINARMSPRSFGRFQRCRTLVQGLFGRVQLFAAQTEEYAKCLRALGAGRVHVTGSIKYDGVQASRDNPRTQELRRLLGVTDMDLVWIAGSTQDPEEKMALDIYQRLKSSRPDLRLILVPRQKERFDEVAALIRARGLPLVRRSQLDPQTGPSASDAVVLLDTFGELSALWGLADVAFVGGSLDGKRGGQNMIEPAAYGAAVIFGPHVWNFRDTARRLVEVEAALQVAHAGELETQVRRLLDEGELRARLGNAARQLVLAQQGATERTLDLLARFLGAAARADAA
ncbi:MAG: 3-deoxy-D-manno-octulosonic acid transferase [Gemmataceae bacterium]